MRALGVAFRIARRFSARLRGRNAAAALDDRPRDLRVLTLLLFASRKNCRIMVDAARICEARRESRLARVGTPLLARRFGQ